MRNDNQQVKISVVIPVFNAEAYISRCIESLKEQSLKELEFIFVDDCSNDNGMDIVNEWAFSDSRVVVLLNEFNLGEGASRNRGIEIARGTYVNTIDPDDWVSPRYYELLYKKAVETDADIVKGTIIRIDEYSHKEVFPRSNSNKLIEMMPANGRPLYSCLFGHPSIIYKREIFSDTVRYGSSANGCDTTFLLRLCEENRRIAVENNAYYYYLQRAGSATDSYSLKRSRNELVSLQEKIEFFLKKDCFDDNAYIYCSNTYQRYASNYCHAKKSESISAKEEAEYISELSKIIMQVPDYPVLYSRLPEMRVLLDEGILLTSKLCEETPILLGELSDWVNYIMTASISTKRTMCSRLMQLLEKHKKERIESRIINRYIKEDLPQIMKCLNQLSIKDKSYIGIQVLKKLTKRIVKRALPINKSV